MMPLKRRHPQHPQELKQICQWVSDAKSILEIGSRYGETLRFLAMSMKGNRLVSVDLPDAEGHKDPFCLPSLIDTVSWLNNGFVVELILGDSHCPDTFNKVALHAPFDVVFIDGDHSYEGAKQDWEMYGRLGKRVIFHDVIIENGLGVSKLWKEIVAKHNVEYQVQEVIAKDSKMGVGMVTW